MAGRDFIGTAVPMGGKQWQNSGMNVRRRCFHAA